ncbi:tc5 transposase DNA-binding domain-containing protein [Apiospora marii]|uniref:tc5 transposase DNA-binding domain-containing protein n=1 Tax=Apiospora marii TaxID=335849 RepID=UPI003130EBB8
MPSNSVSASQYRATELKITEALNSISTNSETNLNELAKKFNVPYYRLRSRYYGRHSRSTRKPAGKRLTKQQEKGLLKRISQVDRCSIEQTANQILQSSHTGNYPPPTVGGNWYLRFFRRYRQQLTPAGDPNSAASADLVLSSTSHGIASTSKRVHHTDMTNALQSATSTTSSIQAQLGQIHDISDRDALEIALEHPAFPPTNLGQPSSSLVFNKTHMLLQPPRTPSSAGPITRPNSRVSLSYSRCAKKAPFTNNEFVFHLNRNDVRRFVSDPHSPLPPQALWISEELLYNIRVYFENSCRRMQFDDHENLLTPDGVKLDNALCSDFDSYCFTATMVMKKGLVIEFRQALSKAYSLIEEILRAEHPRTLACFLEVFIHLIQTGFPDVTTYLRYYIKEMSATVTRKGHPWGEICRLLGELDFESFDQAMAQIWKCTIDIFNSELGTSSRLAVAVRLDYMKRVITTHLEEERLLRDLLAQFRGIPRLPTPRVMLNLAHNLNRQGRYNEAEDMALQVCSLLQTQMTYSGRVVERIESLKIISLCQFNQGRDSEAEWTMREAIRMIVDQWGNQHSWVPEFMIVLEGWLRIWGREEDANIARREIEGLIGKDGID